MAGIITKKLFKVITMLGLLGIPLTYAYPSPLSDDSMIHNNNYEMIRTDDHEPAESMQYQNFEEFFNAELEGSEMSEMQMEESRGTRQVRQPQPLTEKEKRLREHLEVFDVTREKRNQKLLSKGSSQAREHSHDWDQFDYDAHVSSH